MRLTGADYLRLIAGGEVHLEDQSLRPFLEQVNEQRARVRQEPKTEYTATSYGLQTIEDKLLGETERLLHTKGYVVPGRRYLSLQCLRILPRKYFLRAGGLY